MDPQHWFILGLYSVHLIFWVWRAADPDPLVSVFIWLSGFAGLLILIHLDPLSFYFLGLQGCWYGSTWIRFHLIFWILVRIQNYNCNFNVIRGSKNMWQMLGIGLGLDDGQSFMFYFSRCWNTHIIVLIPVVSNSCAANMVLLFIMHQH